MSTKCVQSALLILSANSDISAKIFSRGALRTEVRTTLVQVLRCTVEDYVIPQKTSSER
jgi:hypothetical protein